MPILPAEPSVYPVDLWDHGPVLDGPMRWWCLHTKPRREKATARHLLARQVSYYLPQVMRESRSPGGRKIRSLLPLFPGYVFMVGDDHQRLEAFRSGSLVKILEVTDQATLSQNLRQIHQMLAAGVAVMLEPSHPVGVRVRITTGPLTGLIGVVTRRGPHDRFSAAVEFLGCGVTVALEDWQVERIEPPVGPI